MKKPVRWLLVVLVLAGVSFWIWKNVGADPVEITVETVVRGTVESIVANTRAGTVDACRRARLSPSIGGQIARLPVKEGDQVKTGDLLLEIWNLDIKAQLAVVQQETLVAEASADAACKQAEEAQRQAVRAQTLFTRQVGSKEQKDMAETEAEALLAQCRAARVSVDMKRAQAELVRVNLSRSRLVAPFSGVVAKIEGELNEYVTPSPIGVPTPPVIDIIENSCFYVTAPIDEIDAAAVGPGMKTRITLDAFRKQSFDGVVRRKAPYVLDLEKQARTVDVEVNFDRQDDFSRLLAGYSADVEIILDSRVDVPKIPSEALIDGDSVFVFVESDNVVRKTAVTTGLSNWAFTEIVSGLKEGDRVVINVDNPDLKDGVSAVIREEVR